jgi:phosphoglycolate phosphatase
MEVSVENIKRQMAELGLTQKELAAKSGITVETLSRVLNGKQKLTPNTLHKIAEGLNIPIADIDEERSWSFNYAVQGYLQFADEITHITSFEQLKRWIKKYEPLINDLPQQAKAILSEERRNARMVAKATNTIEIASIDFHREETIEASSMETWSFRKAEDERDGMDIDLGNMCIAYPFECRGRIFTNSEALYICGLFSNDTKKHKEIQEKLIDAKSGYDAKKVVRQKYEDSFARDDWQTFNVEYMKWCVWQKVKGNDDFRKLLVSIPRNAYIIENSTQQKGATALFWGMSNKELEGKRCIIEECAIYKNPTLSKKELNRVQMEERNKINHIGTWQGVNCMGKILKYLQLCLLDNVEPQINYDLLRSKQIYLFGNLLTFDGEATATVQQQQYKTIIFDFDGTLLDTRPLLQYEYLFKQPQRGTEEWKRGRKEYLSHIKDCKQWEGMGNVIEYIRKHHLRTCIVSANTKDRVVEAIKAFGWRDVFSKDDIIGCYALGMKRASKENGDAALFNEALNLMGVKADECIAFGNEICDYQAAKSIGIEAYNCSWGATDRERKIMQRDMADTTIESPLQIIDLL